MSLKFDNTEINYVDVSTPYFGEGVVIRVNKRVIKYYVKSNQLHQMIDDRKDIPESDRVAYRVAASLMSVCTLPESGQFAFDDSQIDDLVNKLPPDLFEAFSVANMKLNPIDTSEPKTLAAKKKKS